MRRMLPRLLTVTEVADALRVHPQTVRTLVKNGRLRAHRLGVNKLSELRISLDSLEAFLTETEVGTRWLARSQAGQ